MIIIAFPSLVDHDAAKRKGVLVREALRLSDLSITKAAIWMGIDRAQLERQLNGDGHLSHARLAMLPMAFWREYGLAICHHCGLPERFQTAVRMAPYVAPTGDRERVS